MKITSCRFVCSAYGPRDEPSDGAPEVVFLGRSNVGKSSLINRLLESRGLARTSSRPGRTQSVNFYRVNDAYYFVDLPGYGYARVPEAVRRNWQPMIEGYLGRHRHAIGLAIVAVDARHRPRRLDLTMRDWLEAESIDYLVVATKADKLSGTGRVLARRSLAREMDGSPVGGPVLFSAETGLGNKEVWRHLDRTLLQEKGNS
ncbi:MAG TPA: ribosome biogenesis GTP-binding protein YihA/YsxC [Candidatus Polarisedimenticolaceae bacterium]|nr:ribosome biogenesis GTP-binding protein YihA/YsxC [Candidatus Polarisedimenticolaceae bacterium]